MNRTVLLRDGAPDFMGDLAMALDRTGSALAMSAGEPERRWKDCSVWEDQNLRIHHADYANSLLVGIDSVARQAMKDRSPRSRNPSDVDMATAWRLRDVVSLPSKGDFSKAKTLDSMRAWLQRTHEALEASSSSPMPLSTHALTRYCSVMAPVYASYLLGQQQRRWLIMFSMGREGLRVCADGNIAVPPAAWMNFSPIQRDMLPEAVANVVDPVTLTIDGGARKIDLATWQHAVSTDVCTGDPIAVARALRGAETARVAEMVLEGDFL